MANTSPENKDPKKVFEERQIAPKEREYYDKVNKNVDDMLESSIGESTNADNEVAELKHTFKEEGIHEAFKKVREELQKNTKDDLTDVVTALDKQTAYLDRYVLSITQILLLHAAQDKEGNKDKINMRELYRLNVAAKGILDALNREYAPIIEKMSQGISLTAKDEQKLVKDLKPFTEKIGPNGCLENLRDIGPYAIIGMMPPDQLFNFMTTYLKGKETIEAQQFLEAMTETGVLTIVQTKALWPKGATFPEKDLQQKREKFIEIQRKKEDNAVTKHDDANQIIEFITDIPGIAFQAWGGIEAFLNGITMAKAGDWKGFFSNPWFLGGVGVAVAGHSLNAKGDAFAFIKEPSASEKEAKQAEENRAKIEGIYANNATQFEKIDNTVVAEMLVAKRNDKQKDTDGKNTSLLELTLSEVIAGMKTKNKKKAGIAYQERIAALEAIQNDSNAGAKLALNEGLTLMLKTPEIETAANIDTIYKDALKNQGLAQKKPIIKPVV